MYLFFDVETNGLPPKKKGIPPRAWECWPRVVQLGFLVYDKDKKLIKKYNQIIKPVDFDIPPDAIKVHGITKEIALEKGIDIVQVLNDFLDALDSCEYIICHNLKFDYNVMLAEYFKNNLTRLSKKKRIKICTMESTTDFCMVPHKYNSKKYNSKKYKWPSLNELHFKLFNELFEDAHDAIADIEATARCFWRLVDDGFFKLKD